MSIRFRSRIVFTNHTEVPYSELSPKVQTHVNDFLNNLKSKIHLVEVLRDPVFHRISVEHPFAYVDHHDGTLVFTSDAIHDDKKPHAKVKVKLEGKSYLLYFIHNLNSDVKT